MFVTDIKNVKNTLDNYGVAVIPDVLTEEQCDDMEDGMMEYLETVMSEFDTPFNRYKKSTYSEFYKLLPMHSMLMQHYGIGHAEFMWKIRCNSAVISVFEEIWNTKDLLVSFDGGSFNPPHEITGRGYYRGKDWLHSDQSYTRNDFECVQSWVTARDVNPDDATLTVLTQSHKYHKEFQHEFEVKEKEDWYKLKPEQVKFYLNKGCEKVDITCSAGSMVLWDSRTIHAGKEALKTRKKPNTRMIGYVCYTPRSLASPAMLKKRIKTYEEGRTTSHWPHKPKLFAKNPRTYGEPLPNVTLPKIPELDEVGRRLVGY